MIRTLCIVPLLLGLSGVVFGQDPAQDEMKKLEGTWQAVSAIADGNKLDDGFVKKRRMVIKDGKQKGYFGDKVVEDYSIEIDPKASPKQITCSDSTRKFLGIYKLEGDKLTWCSSGFNGDPRPAEFASKEGTRNTLLVFERVKK